MSNRLIRCSLCESEGEEFILPADDPISDELLKAHLFEKHHIIYPITLRQEL